MLYRDKVLDGPNLKPDKTYSTYYVAQHTGEHILVDDGLSLQAADEQVEKYQSHGFTAYKREEA